MRGQRHQSDGVASETGAATQPAGRPRAGRGWGPFSGGQLTIIIVTFAVLLLFPIGAWAVSGSNVFVTDATSGQHANVTNGGSLLTTSASPRTFFARNAFVTGTFSPLVKAPAGHALIVTSLNVNVLRAAVTGDGHWLSITVSRTNNTCANVVETPLPLVDVNPGATGIIAIPFQPGIAVPANRALCVDNHDTTNIDADVAAFGYVIPAVAAPAGASVSLPGDTRAATDPNQR